MSIEMRQHVASHPHLIFQNSSQRADLLDERKTQTTLVGLISNLLSKGHIILVTALNSDHHDDSALGPHSHSHGYCMDCWPLRSTHPTDYLNPTDAGFHAFLHDIASDKFEYQIGLGGSADIAENRRAAGPTEFTDNGADHVHIGAK